MHPGLLDFHELQQRAAGQTIGRQIHYHEQVGSTNDVALRFAGERANHGLVVLAENQTQGRGRLGRTWHSPTGASILCSTLLFLDEASTPAKSLLLWTALAVRQVILDVTHVSAEIKWPNDLLVRGKKICGILIESQPHTPNVRAYAVGIGLNCLQHARHFPVDLQGTVTSLDLESAEPIDRLQVAEALLRTLEAWFVRAGTIQPQQLMEEWGAHAASLGRRVRLNSAGQAYSGSIVEIDPQAGILVELDQGGRRLFSPFTTTIEAME